MPEIDFDPQHKRSGSEALEFDRLKLKKDERARIVLLEKPTFAFVHTLRAPKIVNGRATKIEKEGRRGDTYVDYDMDFIGRPQCLGDYGVLADKGVDPANCPACKRSTQADEVFPPERRFALNVIRYGMTRDNKLVQPYACQNLVWTFTETIYNRLIDIAQEHGALVGRDLLLGPCTIEAFQKFEIQAGAQSLWQANDQLKNMVVGTFQANRFADLERACGRKSETRWMVKDLDTIAERWRVARGEKDGTEAVGTTTPLDAGLAHLLNGESSNGTTAPPAAPPAVDMATLLGDQPAVPAADGPPAPEFTGLLGEPASVQPTGTEPAREPAPVTAGASAPTGDAYDFGAILDSLK